MNLLRKFAIGICGLLLSVSLIGLAWSHVGLNTLGNRSAISDWLEESGAYDKAIDALLDSVDRSEVGQEGLPVNDPQVRAVANQAFSSDFLKKSVDGFLNGVYDFMDGNTEKPLFVIDVSDAKAKLASGLANYAAERARSLPACTPAQQVPEEIDVYNIACLPPGVTPEQVGQLASNEILESEEFLPNPTYTADEIKVENSAGEEVPLSESEQLENIKRAYQLSRRLPIIFGVLIVITSAGIVFLSSLKRSGFKRVGKVLITAAVTLGLSYLLLDRGSEWLSNRLAEQDKKDAGAILEIIGDVIRTAAQNVSRLLLVYTIIYAVAGIGILLAVKFVRPRGAAAKSSADLSGIKPLSLENKETIEIEEPVQASSEHKKLD